MFPSKIRRHPVGHTFLSVLFVVATGPALALGSPGPTTTAPLTPFETAAAQQKHTPFDDFLIHGTVFTNTGLAFPGAEVRIRRAGEKRFRWQDTTNSRGDFAFRVPKGASYEVVVHAKHFTDQAKTVNAQSGTTDQTLSFQMEPSGGKK